jgi:hypothetical protein
MVPPNRPKITVDASVLEDFFAFQAYKAARDTLEVASTTTGPGGGGEVVSMPKATSAPKKADSPSEPSSDSGGEGPRVRGGAIRNLSSLRMPPGDSSGTAGLIPIVDEVPWDAHI